MKKLLLALGISALSTLGYVAVAQATSSQENVSVSKQEPGPQAQWNTLVVDLGDVAYMMKTDAEFLLTNTGNQPLIITNARASCGCTNLRYSKDPILPGQTVPVQVTFNGSGRGNIKKTITIQTNASTTPTTLAFTANVVEEKTAVTTPSDLDKKQ